MMKFAIGFAVMGLSWVLSGAAHADTGTQTTSVSADAPKVATPVSAATQESFYDKLKKHAEFTYFGVYHGPGLADLGSSYQPAVDGSRDMTSPQQIESLVTTGYKVNPDTMVGVMNHFYYFPSANPGGVGQDLQMLDPYLVFSRKNMVNTPEFKLNGLLTAELPLSTTGVLRPQHMLTALAPTLSATYNVPHSKLSLGAYGYAAAYIPGTASTDGHRSYKIYFAPNANYQFTETVAGTLWVDLVQTVRNAGTGFFSGMKNATADIEPGVNWDVTKNISLNPSLNLYPSHLTLASTSLLAVVVGKVF